MLCFVTEVFSATGACGVYPSGRAAGGFTTTDGASPGGGWPGLSALRRWAWAEIVRIVQRATAKRRITVKITGSAMNDAIEELAVSPEHAAKWQQLLSG